MAKSSIPHSLNPRKDLSPNFIRAILRYSRKTGVFYWRRRADAPPKWNGRYCGTVAGTAGSNGAIDIRIGKTHYAAHRLAWVYVTGKWPKNDIDHKDTNPANNRWRNLRGATGSQNNWNCGPRKRNKSGFKGVSWHTQRSKWVAQIAAKNCRYYLGLFGTKEEAAEAYKKASARLHGRFSRLT